MLLHSDLATDSDLLFSSSLLLLPPSVARLPCSPLTILSLAEVPGSVVSLAPSLVLPALAHFSCFVTPLHKNRLSSLARSRLLAPTHSLCLYDCAMFTPLQLTYRLNELSTLLSPSTPPSTSVCTSMSCLFVCDLATANFSHNAICFHLPSFAFACFP
jgi:hypothetical protein